MVTRKEFNSIIPAKIVISQNYNRLTEYAKNLCKEVFCNNNICNNCLTCKQIQENRYHNIIWLNTEKQFKLEDLDPIFEQISIALDPDEKFFFIIEEANKLSHACSNRLLKVVEEPPAGYNFIFLTDRPQDIIETIKSRCIKIDLRDTKDIQKEPLIKYFTTENISAPEFLSYIDKSNINEQDTINFVDDILKFYIENKNFKKLEIIENAFKNSPNSGGSKLFWKNLFTKFNQDTKL